MQLLARSSDPPPPSSVLDELVRQIAESDTFRSAPMMRTLLFYLWKHQGEPIGEYAIAVDALGRAANFDPKTDSTVRVQIARLRAKLREFNEASEGFPLRLSIPLGRHELQWTYEQPRTPAAAALDAIPRKYLIGTLAVGLALGALCIALAVQNARLRAAMPEPPPPLPRFWQSFFAGGRPATIVVPSPLYFFWPEHNLYARDLKITDFGQWNISEGLKIISGKWGAPTLAQTYVGAGEMNNGVRILQYLEKRGEQIELTESRKFRTESVATQNTIFLGMPRTAAYLDQFARKLNFYIAHVEPDIVRSRNPAPGEQVEYQEVVYSNDRKKVPAIITLLPPRAEKTRSLLLMGKSLSCITAMLLTGEGLRQLDEQWKKAGSPDAWEMVIEADLYNTDTVQKVWPVSFRAIGPGFWNQ